MYRISANSLWLVVISVLSVVAPVRAELSIDPQSQDQYSGRTITAGSMAGSVILSRNENAPRPGDEAPPLTLSSLETEATVDLQDLLDEKPLVLLFSSWTCNVLRESLAGLTLLGQTFGDDVDFAFVYIREAHPGGGDFGMIEDPESDAERIEAAVRFRKQTRIPFPIFVDRVDDRAATRWAAWPLRVYVVDPDGTVVYSGAPGPWGYRPYDDFLHGDGVWYEMDEGFNKNSLEQFLTERYSDEKGVSDVEGTRP